MESGRERARKRSGEVVLAEVEMEERDGDRGDFPGETAVGGEDYDPEAG